MAKEIVVGFDESEQARDAVVLGSRLADATGCRLVVVNVFFHDRMFDALTYGDYERDAEAHAQEILKQATELLGDRRAETVAVGSASSARGLHDLAEEREAAAIVVGSTHRGKLGRVAPGSVGRQLLTGGPCAVAVAPSGLAATDVRFGTIGVAFDASAESHSALRAATGIARRLGVQVDLIGVVRPPQPLLGASYAITTGNRVFTDEVRDELERQSLEAMETVPDECRGSVDVQVGDPTDLLVARSEGLDLLVCGSRGYGLGRQVLLGSMSARLVDRARCPVLVVPRGGAPVFERVEPRGGSGSRVAR